MFKKIFSNFKSLPGSNRSMVFLLWIYYVGNVIANIFINIYIYKLNNSFNDLIIYYIFYFTFTFFGFSVVGYFMSIYSKNIKYLYYYSYLFFVLSFLLLFVYGNNYLGILLFGALYGFGHGLFWNGIHTQELANIKNKKRDLYASAVSIGKIFAEIIIPLFVSVVFIISKKNESNGYMVLFFVLPFIYMFSFFFINQIEDYVPNRIKYNDLKKFFSLKKHKYGNMFFVFGGIQGVVSTVIMGVLSLYMLKNEINIGFFQGILAFLSSILVVHFSFNRNEKNRFKYMLFFGILYFLNYILFVFNFTIYGFIIFILFNLLLLPLFRVSNHVYTLSLVDNMKVDKLDFYTGMMAREICLYFGRIIILIVMYFVINKFYFSSEIILRGGLTFVGILFLVLIINIYLWEKNEEKK